jgi:hypothetical protein
MFDLFDLFDLFELGSYNEPNAVVEMPDGGM